MASSLCIDLSPLDRKIAFRSHCIPKMSNTPPTTSRKIFRGMLTSAGPNAATNAASTNNAAATPSNAERQPLVWPTANTIVSASTIYTQQVRNTAPTRTTTPDETDVTMNTLNATRWRAPDTPKQTRVGLLRRRVGAVRLRSPRGRVRGFAATQACGTTNRPLRSRHAHRLRRAPPRPIRQPPHRLFGPLEAFHRARATRRTNQRNRPLHAEVSCATATA